MDQRSPTAIDEVVEKLGSQVALATLCKVTPQRVNQWVQKGKVPPKYVLVIEAATGVSRHKLDPEVFGAPPQATLQ